MKVVIVGFDTEGRSSLAYFKAQGHDVEVRDQNPDLDVPESIPHVLGETYLDNLDEFDIIVRTAGLHPQKILDKNPGIADKITTQINEFIKVCPTRNLIGVTGTKGKGTTSSLITKMLAAAGKDVRLGGNIGVPPFTFLQDITEDSWVVLELSSYQLIDLQRSPHIATCLMVVPEHLDWHKDIDEYYGAKQQLFNHQTENDIAVYYAENETSQRIASASKGTKVPYFAEPGAVVENDSITIDGQPICRVDELKLLGRHNWQNACAAVTTVWQAGVRDINALRAVLTSFAGLPHRLELVREYNGVHYFNDSFATGLHATEAAIDAIPQKKVMILGGYDRMIDLEHFGIFVRERTDAFRTLLLIGASAPRLADVLTNAGFDNFVLDTDAKSMPDVVARAAKLAQPGDAVVLSPGFASFDMFKNFEDRGNQYREAVSKL